MARPKGSPDLTPAMRGGLLRALKIIDDSKRPMSTRWVEAFEEDFLATMTVAARFLPKDVNVEMGGSVDLNTNSLPADALKEAFLAKRAEVVSIDDKRDAG